MAAPNPPVNLDISCFSGDAVPPDIKREIITRFWPTAQAQIDNVDDFSAYFSFFESESHPDVQSSNAVRTFSQLLELLDIVRNNTDAALIDLRTTVQTTIAGIGTDDDQITASIELVVRLWLMVNVRNMMPSNRLALQTAVPWHNSRSLQDVIQGVTRAPAAAQGVQKKGFSEDLNVCNLENIGGFEIIWTSDLLSHLSVDGTAIYVFHHITVLQRIQESVPANLLPAGFLDETKATLGTLVPPDNAKCNDWLMKEKKENGLDPGVLVERIIDRRVGSYSHWQERLLTISQLYDNANPKTLGQFIADRRDLTKWWGFWAAVGGLFLTLLFGLIQSVTGIILVVKG